MIPTIPQNPLIRIAYGAYVALFFIYLALPLTVVAVFAFNDSQFPSLPWEGFTLGWFFGSERPMIGVFQEGPILRAIGTSVIIGLAVSALSVAVGTTNAFLFNRYQFRGRGLLYVLMLLPLVIPGIVLGISILVFSSTLANAAWDAAEFDIQALRPGLVLVILGQFSFVTTIATLVIAARLQKFDRTLEEAALNLGANHLTAVRTITLPYLAPAMIGAFVVSFLMSFENFNTTLMLVGSDSPLTIAMFDRLKLGSTPLLNAVSLLLMLGSSLLALVMIAFQRKS
ncbi:ABC transporter permease subunit [Seohaeicola sp. SP36]|jgi:spermidine/putrescine transport system permease protein|uniref:ABC transporter permease n=1 Tax=unclassified Seohaeicola TaxID=2641111 RepID=UPI00237AD833|nr:MULTISPECIES: ABC transporter permease subunit [unclassified Seohaeicola]MDD9706683.1 ABC transporter permease subunit [Seohaeicola sp. 4SK31]MDD9734389.1 ABC transporter permease subunit [Seohaeicola sp. SP36]